MAVPNLSFGQRYIPQNPLVNSKYIPNVHVRENRWCSSFGPNARRENVDPCVNNVNFQGATIEWPADCDGLGFDEGNDGPGCYASIGLQYYGNDRRLMLGNYVASDGRHMRYAKPHACVFQGPNPDASVGPSVSGSIMGWAERPRVTGSASDATSPVCGDDSEFGSNTVNTAEPYVPESVLGRRNVAWYPDFGATHHVCKEAARLHASSPYSGTAPLLMGDGTCAKIAGTSDSVLIGSSRILHLTNVLHVPTIWKNLMSVS